MRSSRVLLNSIVIAGFALAGSAVAGGPLLDLRTSVDPSATTLYLRFGETVEYTPDWINSRTFAIDVTGTSTTLPSKAQVLRSPLVNTYKVSNYQGADNLPHLRLEIALKAEAKIDAQQNRGEVTLKIEPSTPQTADPANAVPLNPKRGTAIHAVQVAKLEGTNTLEVQILGNGSLEYRTMELSNPRRVVVDIPETINRIRQRVLPVNAAPLRSVRIGQLSRTPLVSRVVLDLDSKSPVEFRKEASTIVVSLQQTDARSAAQVDAPSSATLTQQ